MHEANNWITNLAKMESKLFLFLLQLICLVQHYLGAKHYLVEVSDPPRLNRQRVISIGDVIHGPTDVGTTQKQVPYSEDIVKAVNHVAILGDSLTFEIIILPSVPNQLFPLAILCFQHPGCLVQDLNPRGQRRCQS